MTMTKRPKVTDLYAFLLCLLLACSSISSAFTSPPASASHHDRSLTVLNGKRKGGLKKSLEGDPNNPKSLNQGRGQEITGVTLPAEGKIKGWEFGNNLRMAAAQVNGNFYAVQGECPRCAFDLWKGTLVTDEAFGPDLPRVACPTCATTFSFKTGTHGPALRCRRIAIHPQRCIILVGEERQEQDGRILLLGTNANQRQLHAEAECTNPHWIQTAQGNCCIIV